MRYPERNQWPGHHSLKSAIDYAHNNMKNTILTTLALLPSLAAAPPLLSQTYNIDWFTIDGGGGTSTGGVYSVSGTIGQPDAGVMSGGSYSLAGGFWAIIGVLPEPGAPLLMVTRIAPNTVRVS